jgi:ribosomal protein L37AE/L43A
MSSNKSSTSKTDPDSPPTKSSRRAVANALATQHSRLRAGKCRRCGAKRGASKIHCDRCALEVRKYMRARTGSSKHVEGGRGRPPLI